MFIRSEISRPRGKGGEWPSPRSGHRMVRATSHLGSYLYDRCDDTACVERLHSPFWWFLRGAKRCEHLGTESTADPNNVLTCRFAGSTICIYIHFKKSDGLVWLINLSVRFRNPGGVPRDDASVVPSVLYVLMLAWLYLSGRGF